MDLNLAFALGSTGWLTWIGQDIANKSVTKMAKHFSEILAYANGTGSVNLYMAAGGTNFGFTAGATVSAVYEWFWGISAASPVGNNMQAERAPFTLQLMCCVRMPGMQRVIDCLPYPYSQKQANLPALGMCRRAAGLQNGQVGVEAGRARPAGLLRARHHQLRLRLADQRVGRDGPAGPRRAQQLRGVPPCAPAPPEISQVELTSAYGISKKDRVEFSDVTHAVKKSA